MGIKRCINPETVVFQRVASTYWAERLRLLIEEHAHETGSGRAQALLDGFEWELPRFQQICPKEMVGRLEHPLSDEIIVEKSA